jgi:type VI secretion system secreted protein VgrG
VGDVGTYSTLTETGFGSFVLTGTNHVGDATTQGAKNDLTTAYNTAVSEASTSAISADLGG